MTSVRVADAAQTGWDDFYDDWVNVFVREVPATRRGARWRVTSGLAGGAEVLPVAGWPMYLATMEYDRLDQFILSRAWRRRPEWEPRVKSFKPWFPSLQDYATLNLLRVQRVGSDGPGVPPAVLSSIWSIDPAQLEGFDAWYESEVVDGFFQRLTGARSTSRYVAMLAQLHRSAGPDGELVIPRRFHFEDGGRLCYVALVELEALPDPAAQRATLAALNERLARWDGALEDRQEAFAERVLLVDR
jgi:hypothetical protein